MRTTKMAMPTHSWAGVLRAVLVPSSTEAKMANHRWKDSKPPLAVSSPFGDD